MIDTQPVVLPYTVEAQFLCSKTGDKDIIYVGSHFVAVIDGATSKSKRRWDGESGGRMAALLVQQAFERIPPGATNRPKDSKGKTSRSTTGPT